MRAGVGGWGEGGALRGKREASEARGKGRSTEGQGAALGLGRGQGLVGIPKGGRGSLEWEQRGGERRF